MYFQDGSSKIPHVFKLLYLISLSNKSNHVPFWFMASLYTHPMFIYYHLLSIFYIAKYHLISPKSLNIKRGYLGIKRGFGEFPARTLQPWPWRNRLWALPLKSHRRWCARDSRRSRLGVISGHFCGKNVAKYVFSTTLSGIFGILSGMCSSGAWDRYHASWSG